MSNSKFRHIVCHPEALEVALNNKTIDPNQCSDFYLTSNDRQLPVRRGDFNTLNVFNGIIKNEPILVTALLVGRPGVCAGEKDAVRSVEILLKNGANPAVAFNYLMQPGIERNFFHAMSFNYEGIVSEKDELLLYLDFLFKKCVEIDKSFQLDGDQLSNEALKRLDQKVNPYLEDASLTIIEFERLKTALRAINTKELIEQRSYQEKLFDLTDKSERRGNWSRNLGYGTNNRGLVQAVLAPVGWAVQAVAVKPVDKELAALRALRVEQLTARYLKENGYPADQELLETEVADIQNQQRAEETAMLRQRNAMLLDRAVERQLQL